MNQDELKNLVASFEDRVRECRLETEQVGAGPQVTNYTSILQGLETALPKIEQLYIENSSLLRDADLARTKQGLRVLRDPKPRALDSFVHDLRHDFFEIVHPLEVIGKWPPDPQTDGLEHRGVRGIGKWPPDPA